MGFDSGSISFRRFAVVGEQPKAIDEALFQQLSEHALNSEEDSLGLPDEIEYGFCGGRHVLDTQFSFDNNVFADALHFALRIDTNKVPTELIKAFKAIEEDAAAKSNPSGFISKNQKRSAREIVQEKIEKELRGGKYRRSKPIPILWDLPSATLYCNASANAEEKLHEIFERAFGLTLEPLSAGTLALRLLQKKGGRRDYEDAKPTRFADGPEGDSQAPDYPWVAKGPEAKDFLGNEFLLWLWHGADHGEVDVTVFFDRVLNLDCSFGQTGRDSLMGTGPTRMPEAIVALRSGKVPRRAGMMLDSQGMQYNLTLAAESFAVSSLKLPNVEEADNPRTLFEERIAMLRDFSKMFDRLYGDFLKSRAGSSWEGKADAIRKWIAHSRRSAAKSQEVVSNVSDLGVQTPTDYRKTNPPASPQHQPS